MLTSKQLITVRHPYAFLLTATGRRTCKTTGSATLREMANVLLYFATAVTVTSGYCILKQNAENSLFRRYNGRRTGLGSKARAPTASTMPGTGPPDSPVAPAKQAAGFRVRLVRFSGDRHLLFQQTPNVMMPEHQSGIIISWRAL